MASQITSLTIVYPTVYSAADQRKHQNSASLAFVRGIHRSPVNSPHKWPVTRKMFPFDDVIMDIFPAVAAYTSQNITATQFQWNWYKLLITPMVPIPPDRPAVWPHYQHLSWLWRTCVHLTVDIESRGSLGETDMRTIMGWSPETRGRTIGYLSEICHGCYGQPKFRKIRV